MGKHHRERRRQLNVPGKLEAYPTSFVLRIQFGRAILVVDLSAERVAELVHEERHFLGVLFRLLDPLFFRQLERSSRP